ncbi:MAG TPA: CBS domain-containing protein [Thermomicrobiales bacterium]|nr:CBS domain-containing protein [Thermomicrobiales bacterium]
MSEQLLVRDAMAPLSEMIQSGQTLVAARQRMQGDTRVKSLIVVEGDRPVGMLRYGDVSGAEVRQGTTVADVMVTDVPTARGDQTLEELSGLMTQYDVDRLPVVDANGALIGELPRVALTQAQTTSTEATGWAEASTVGHPREQEPVYDLKKDMAVVGVQGSKVGKVREVTADALTGSLTHVVVHTGLLFGKDKSIPVDLIDHVAGDEIYLKVDKSDVDMLPDIHANA